MPPAPWAREACVGALPTLLTSTRSASSAARRSTRARSLRARWAWRVLGHFAARSSLKALRRSRSSSLWSCWWSATCIDEHDAAATDELGPSTRPASRGWRCSSASRPAQQHALARPLPHRRLDLLELPPSQVRVLGRLLSHRAVVVVAACCGSWAPHRVVRGMPSPWPSSRSRASTVSCAEDPEQR